MFKRENEGQPFISVMRILGTCNETLFNLGFVTRPRILYRIFREDEGDCKMSKTRQKIKEIVYQYILPYLRIAKRKAV